MWHHAQILGSEHGQKQRQQLPVQTGKALVHSSGSASWQLKQRHLEDFQVVKQAECCSFDALDDAMYGQIEAATVIFVRRHRVWMD